MQKKTKIIGGSALALAVALIGGTTLTAGALATPPAAPPSVSDTSTGTSAGTGTEQGTEGVEPAEGNGPDTDNIQEGPGNQTENTSDDVNGVAVEDGTAD